MNRLLIVSNRLPVSVYKRGGKLQFQQSVGGLATGIGSLLEKSYSSIWVGWPGISESKIPPAEKENMFSDLADINCHTVSLSQREIDNFYSGFCNKTLWPLFHYFIKNTVYDKAFWRSYQEVNNRFCEAVLEVMQKDDIIWIHDYHLMLLPSLLRKKLPDNKIGFFLHIPFPSFETFRLLPWRKEILEGLLGSDLIGFHTYDYVMHFLDSTRNLLAYDHNFGKLMVGKRVVKADSFPMGIDYKRYSAASHQPEVAREIRKVKKRVEGLKVILSVDRLDYSKGIPERLHSYNLFLDKYPEYKEKVVLILVAVPSRTKVEQYKELKKNLDELVGNINGKHGVIGWTPIMYLYSLLPFTPLTALYYISDIALLTPLRDGMNLIAKEYVASVSDGDGVLILSEMAGASKEMSEALMVNPNNIDNIADCIKTALTMPIEERTERIRNMQKRLEAYDVKNWAEDFIGTLETIASLKQEMYSPHITHLQIRKLLADYNQSKKRLLLLDYDGTLRNLTKTPSQAAPDGDELEILKNLAADKNNNVMIISGRDRNTLSEWLADLDVGIVAEHGVWIKKKGGDWELEEPMDNTWKEELRPILKRYETRTPGALVEEKEYSMAWHFRNVNPALAAVRSRELRESIGYIISNVDLEIMQGNKVMEIKKGGINKGKAVQRFLNKGYDFIFAAGDDRTDEDLFAVLPARAYTLKVGKPPSKASFTIKSPDELKELLGKMAMVKV